MIEYIVQGGAIGLCIVLAVLLWKIFEKMHKSQVDTIVILTKVISENTSVLNSNTAALIANTKAFDKLYQLILTNSNLNLNNFKKELNDEMD